MSGWETVGGGGGGGGHHHHHHGGSNDLTVSERAAAQHALAKLTGSGASNLLAANASPSGGADAIASLKTLSNGLLTGLGSDTFAGGSAPASLVLGKFAADSVLGGSLAKAVSPTASPNFRLSADTINVAGTTAAVVKSLDPTPALGTSHTVTLSDKTTLTVSGVHSNAIVKHSGH